MVESWVIFEFYEILLTTPKVLWCWMYYFDKFRPSSESELTYISFYCIFYASVSSLIDWFRSLKTAVCLLLILLSCNASRIVSYLIIFFFLRYLIELIISCSFSFIYWSRIESARFRSFSALSWSWWYISDDRISSLLSKTKYDWDPDPFLEPLSLKL